MIIGWIILVCLGLGLAAWAIQTLLWLFKNLGTIFWIVATIALALFCLLVLGPWVAGMSPISVLILYLAIRDSNRDSRPPL
jgi:hypothetical protein